MVARVLQPDHHGRLLAGLGRRALVHGRHPGPHRVVVVVMVEVVHRVVELLRHELARCLAGGS